MRSVLFLQARVPFADVGPLKVPEGLSDQQVLLLSDVLPTGYMGAENCDIQPGDTVAVWGRGPVGQFFDKSAWMFGAERVLAIDRVPKRLEMARRYGGAEVIDYKEGKDVVEILKEMTGGPAPDAVIESVGAEAHGTGADYVYNKIKQATRMEDGCIKVVLKPND